MQPPHRASARHSAGRSARSNRLRPGLVGMSDISKVKPQCTHPACNAKFAHNSNSGHMSPNHAI
eukprot:13472495-Heterocapsa_arctica.AAC.1